MNATTRHPSPLANPRHLKVVEKRAIIESHARGVISWEDIAATYGYADAKSASVSLRRFARERGLHVRREKSDGGKGRLRPRATRPEIPVAYALWQTGNYTWAEVAEKASGFEPTSPRSAHRLHDGCAATCEGARSSTAVRGPVKANRLDDVSKQATCVAAR